MVKKSSLRKRKIKQIRKKSTGKKIRGFAKKRRADEIRNFSKKVLEKYRYLIKSIIAMGSVVRDEFTGKSDTDLIILVDDTRKEFNKELRKEIDEFLYKTAKEVSGKSRTGEQLLHPQPCWTMTEFWAMTRRISPLVYNVIKDGIPVYDTGFFIPFKNLLKMGEIPATKEAADKRMESAPKRIRVAKSAKLFIVAEDLYLSVLDSTQAVIMFMGLGPPGPGQAVDVAKNYLVDSDLLEKKYLQYLEEILAFRKKVEHREVKEITGADVDEYIKKAEEYVKQMEKVLKILEKRKKTEGIEKNYEVMLKASIAALKAINKLPEDPKKLSMAFKEHLIEKKLVNPIYEGVMEKVLEMKKDLHEDKLEKISYKDISMTREYVRRFIGEVRKIFEERGIKPKDLKETKIPKKKKTRKSHKSRKIPKAKK